MSVCAHAQEMKLALRAVNREQNTNVEVAQFSLVAPGCYVCACGAEQQGRFMQIYPGDAHKTFFQLPHGCSLFVVGAAGSGELKTIVYGETLDPDCYVYFVLETPVIYVLVTDSMEAALQMIKKAL